MKKVLSLLILVLLSISISMPVNAEIITDTTGPTVTNAYCDKQGQTLKPGDTVKFSFSASDPSGLKPGISVNFYQATSYVGDIRLSSWSYNSSTNKYEASCTIPESAKRGEYYISTIYVYDIHDNQTAYGTHLGFYIGMENPNNTTTKPSGTETTKPSGTETTKPSDTETTKPSDTETTKPSGTETTKPSSTETTKPSDSTTTDTTKKEPSNILWVIIASIISVVAIAGVGTVVVIRKKQNKA